MPDIFAVSDEAVDRIATINPVLATDHGLSGYDHLWPDLSPEGHAKAREVYASIRADALACSNQGRRDRLAQEVLVQYCDEWIENHDAGSLQVDLNNIESPHQHMRFIYGSQATETAEDWEAILERLSTVEQPLDGYRKTLEQGRESGNLVSRRQVEAVVEQGEVAIGSESPFDELRNQLRSSNLDTALIEPRLSKAIDHAKAAYASFNQFLSTSYLPSAPEADAVGVDRYQLAARTFLGTDLDVVETYRWGWDEVERLWGKMQQACAAVDPDASLEQVVEMLRSDPAYAVQEPEEFVEIMLERQHQALANLEGVHFDVPEKIREIAVQIEPAGGALAAHYTGPSEDFSRPGSVWYPIAGRRHFPLFAEVSTAYHEGFPGHHLQVGVQATLADELSRFHRLLAWYPGSGEGWALYAEHLMGELGYLERPEYVVGLLSSQLLRACRVAIDIGSHLEFPIPDDVTFHPGETWTFELAYKLLVDRALSSSDEAASEVTRYLGWPGQAISYKVGEQAILDLRAEREAKPGFDPKLFHSEVLAVGSTGLDLLRRELA